MKTAIFYILSIVLVLSIASPSHGKILEKIYAVVNGSVITLTDIADYQKKLNEGGFLNDLLFSDPKEKEKSQKDRQFLIKKIIDEKIIDFNVKKNGFTATESQIDREIDNIAKTRSMGRSDLIAALKSQNVNYNSYRKFISDSLSRRQLVEKEITSKIKISEEDIISHYLAQKGETSKSAFSYKVFHILLEKNDKAKAMKIAKTVNASNFESLVSENSTDPSSKEKNGFFGVFKSGEMAGPMESAISGLGVNQISPVVETPMGLHIFKLTEKKRIVDPQIEKARPMIYQSLFGKLFKEQFDYWLSQQRKSAIIQINQS